MSYGYSPPTAHTEASLNLPTAARAAIAFIFSDSAAQGIQHCAFQSPVPGRQSRSRTPLGYAEQEAQQRPSVGRQNQVSRNPEDAECNAGFPLLAKRELRGGFWLMAAQERGAPCGMSLPFGGKRSAGLPSAAASAAAAAKATGGVAYRRWLLGGFRGQKKEHLALLSRRHLC
ncbi:hypothetical protein FB645_003955 [Coemansia sp. IMI 203386]|nr:hypothetical protein FB645_003955 [Coemansia sp. IMI 203386]